MRHAIVKDSQGRAVTDVRNIGTRHEPVTVWRTDTGQPALVWPKDVAEEWVKNMNSKPDVSGFVVEEM